MMLGNLNVGMLNLVTKKDNEMLLEPIHDLKIKDAIFQMDIYKAQGYDVFAAAYEVLISLLRRKNAQTNKSYAYCTYS